MTSFAQEDITCFVCGVTNKYQVLMSTNAFGSMDLDTRPPPMMRWTLPTGIHRCPNCHYCAPDVATGPAVAGEVVTSEAYRRQERDETYPDLANQYLCWSLVAEKAGQYAIAGWAATNAAWDCDDNEAKLGADKSRLRAIGLFRWAKLKGLRFAESAGGEFAILADLHRRRGDFAAVMEMSEKGLRAEPEELVEQVLTYQRYLSERADVRCYTIEEMQKAQDT